MNKPKSKNQHLPRFSLLLLLMTGMAATSSAADGHWSVDADGDWSGTGNWLGGIVADGAGSGAFFTNDITTARTVTLDSARTVGKLRFGDADLATAAGWIISNGGNAANTLSLTNSVETSAITVMPINVDNGIDSTNDAFINAVLSSSQGFIKKGAGTLTLTGANVFGASVQLDEGLVGIGNSSALGGGNRPVIHNGGGIRVWNGGPGFANTNQILTTCTIVSSNGNYDSLTGPFIGSGTIFIHSTGRLSPGGTGNAAAVGHLFAAFNGTIDLTDSPGGNETRINLGSGSALFNLSTVALNTGTGGGRFSFRMNVAPGVVRIGSLAGGPGTRLMSSEQTAGTSLTWEIGYLNTSTTFEGTIQNRNGSAERVGHLTKVGTGTLKLTGNGTYTGNTVISNGILALGSTAQLSATPSILLATSTAIFDVSEFSPNWSPTVAHIIGGNGVVTGNVAMTTGTISPGTSIGKITFANDLLLDGNSTTTSNVFELGAGTNDLIHVNGNLDLTGVTVVRLVPTGPVIANGNYTLFKWNGNLTGDANNFILEYPPQTGTLALFVDSGAKEIILQVSDVPSAADLVWRGDGGANAWDFATANWRNGANPSVFSGGDNVIFNDSGSNNVPVDLQIVAAPGSLVVNAAQDYVISSSSGTGRISGGASLLKTNGGMLTLTTENDYLGDTTVAAGRLQVGEGFGTGTLGAGTLTNNGTVIFNRGADLTFAPPVRGTGTLVQAGNDVLTLTGNNSHSGNTVVSNGTLRVSSTAALGTGSAVIAGGILNPQSQVTNAIQVTANGTLLGTAEVSLSGTLSGIGGTLAIDNTAGNGFRFAQTASFTFNRPIDLQSANARTVAFYNTGSTQTYTGVISGVGGIHRRSPSAGSANDAIGGHVVFTAANTFSGGTTMSEGNIGLGSSTVVDGDGVTVLSGPLGTGPITYSPPATTTAPFAWIALYAVGGPRTLANPITFASVTADTLQEAFTIDGVNDLTLSGTLTIDQTAFASGIRVNNETTTISGSIGGAGSIVKLGAGTLRVSGDNTYAGSTTVDAGTLLVMNTTGSGTSGGGVTVNSGGTLGGTGTIAGNTTIQAGGTLAPGTSVGTLSFGGDLTINGNIAVEVHRSQSPSNDMVMVTGALSNSGNGNLTVSNLGPDLAVGNRFVVFNKPVANGGALTVTGGGANWANNLATDGSITVTSLVSVNPPTISSIVASGGNLIFSGTNGTAGSTYYVLSSTNLATALSTWARTITNTFGPGGVFSVTNAIAPGEPQRFYLLQVP